MIPKNTNSHSKYTRLISLSAVSVLSVVLFSGCAATAHTTPYYDYDYGHSYPGMYEYYYYPDVDVYYNPYQRHYYYHHGTRGWLSVTILPSYIHLNRHNYHVIRSRHHKPWNYSHAYKRHHKHYGGHEKRHEYRQHDKRHHEKQYHEKRHHESDNRHGSQYSPPARQKRVVIKNDHHRQPDTRKTHEHGRKQVHRENPGGHNYVSRKAKKLAKQHTRDRSADTHRKRKYSEKYTSRKDGTKKKHASKQDRRKKDREAKRKEQRNSRFSSGKKRRDGDINRRESHRDYHLN